MTEDNSKPTFVREVSEEELAEFVDAFTIFDTDGDGLVTNRDLGPTMRLLGVTPTEAEIHEMLAVMDQQRTGSFALKEFLEMMAQKIPYEYNEDDLKEAFRVCDKDANGMIGFQDMRTIINNLGDTLTDEDIDEMIREADIDGDGQVNYDEFLYIMGANK